MTLTDMIIGFISGLLGSMGFGGGTALIVYLTVFEAIEQKQAQGINLVFFLPYAIYSVFSYVKSDMIDKKIILPVIFFSLAGSVIGFILLENIQTVFLSKCFGVFLLLLGSKELFTKNTKADGTSEKS